MKIEVVTKIIAVLSLFGMSNALADTFLSTFDSFKLRHLPSLYTEIIENTYFQYIVENGRALLFNYKYNGQGYAQAYAVNAVYAKGGVDNKYSEPYYVYGQMDVPNELGGYPLLKIGERAFQGCSQITGVSIPEGVIDIAQEAFKSCKNLRTFVCASSVTNIGYDAFSGAEGVTKFVFPGNTKFTGTISATNVCDLTVPVMKVAERFTCGHVTNLVFNKFGIQKFSKDTFSGCSAVTALELRGQIESVNANSFSSALPNLEIVYVTFESNRKVRDALELANRSDVEVRIIDGEGNRIEGAGFVEDVVVSGDSEDVYYPRTVEITCPTDGAVIHYTVDGSVVTETSPIYKGPFVISETTTVRAKAYKADWFPSEEVSQSFKRLWHTAEVPVISATSAAFDGASQEVTISCATEGARIYYTIDGSEPSAANGRVYKGPFNIYDSVTVKAIAVKDDWKDSAVASAAFTKNNGLSAAINMYDYLPDNDASAPWTVDTEVSHDGVKSVRSGAIGENGVTTMKVTVRGAGRLSFWWKSECEAWDEDYYDYGAFCVGSETEPRLRIAGMTDWKREEIVLDGTGKHVCKWEYHKDDAETIPRDCIWVDQVQWLPYGESGHDHTLTTEVPVPYLWLDSYGLGRETDFETAAKMKLGKVDGAGRAMSVEDDYVAGTDPTNLASKLTATIKMGADGKPIVSWKPSLNGEDADGAGIREGVRSYSVYGKQALDDAAEAWTPVAEGAEGNYRFFKVGVGMPEKQ